MPPPRQPLGRPLDPEGYYARLGVVPESGPDAITAAYRRKARLVHPDVPGTGDASAFVELKQAYDVLIRPERRAAYDRSARQAVPSAPEQEPGEIGAKPFPTMASPPTRHPRLRDLPIGVWVGMAAVLMLGLVEVGLHLTRLPTQEQQEAIPATAPDVPPLAANDPGPALVRPGAGSPRGNGKLLHRADRQFGHAVACGRGSPHAGALGPIAGLQFGAGAAVAETERDGGNQGHRQHQRLCRGGSADTRRLQLPPRGPGAPTTPARRLRTARC